MERDGGRGGRERGPSRKGIEDVLVLCGAGRVADELAEAFV